MKLLLGSGGFRTAERIAAWVDQLRSFLPRNTRLVFIPYALADHDAYVRAMMERGLHGGYPLVGLHSFADPRQTIRDAEAIFVGGGNTFRLLDWLYRLQLLEAIRERVAAGVPYLGISAGTNVACPTIRTTNDMPIVQPPSFNALGLIHFQINPHYLSGRTMIQVGNDLIEHFGETRDDRIREFHEENDLPVLGVWEGGMVRVEGQRLELIAAPARWFRRGCEPIDLQPGPLALPD